MKRQTSQSWPPPPSRVCTEPAVLADVETLRQKTEPLAESSRSFPIAGILARRRGFSLGSRLRIPGPMQGWREVLCARGYSVGGVIGLSRANCGFGVHLVNKDGQSFAAKGTNEGIQDGTLNTTLQREYRVLRGLRHPGVVRVEEFVDAA